MKANLKGMSGVKGLLLLHGEKIVIGVVGLLALWFIYSSLSLPRLAPQFQANNLQQEISQTTATVQNSDWPSRGSEQADNVRYSEPIEESNASLAVSPAPYIDPSPFPGGFRPVIPPTMLRTDPLLLNAVEVRATGGTGLFSFADEAIRQQQELRQRALEQQRQRDQEKMAQRQQQQFEQPRGARARREAQGAEFGFAEVDPNNPNRRLIQGMTQAAGVPLQGGERIERAHWAIVVAKVPIREQLKLYQDAFENARGYDPTNDFPAYLGYMVQRSEVVRGRPLDWQPVAVYDAQQKNIRAKKPIAPVVNQSAVMKLQEEAAANWAGQAVEPVDPRYIDPILTLPLPPLVGRDFGAEATHPDIPLAINAPPMEEEQPEMLADQPEQPAVDPDDPRALFRSDPSQQLTRPQFGGTGMGGRMPGGFRGGYGEMGGYGRGLRGSPYMGEEMGMRGRGEFGGPGMGGQAGMLPRGVDFWLLRFIDYTVEPGKKYKYRVRLVLRDPNYGVEERALDPTVVDRVRASKREARLVEDWSDPSPTVGIPIAGSVYLAEVRPPSGRSFNDEPLAKLFVEKFDVDAKEGTAVRVAKESDFRRGYVVNLDEKNARYTGDGDRWLDTYDSYKLYTNVTVLDVYGGQSLNRDYRAPSRMLAMDAAGELSIRKELDDATDVQYLRLLFTDDKRRGAEDMRFGPGMPFGEEMMMRGGRR